jgi:hypothetical protein
MMIDKSVSLGYGVSADAYRSKILPLRARVEVKNKWLRERLGALLPELMKREGFDMWILVAKQYVEDPVLMTLLPEPLLYASTTIVFNLNADGNLERLTLSRRPLGDFYQSVWYSEKEKQYECLARVVKERDPKVIGINISKDFGHSAALPYSEYLQMAEALGEQYMSRTKNAERLSVGWLERRIPSELTIYPGIVELGHAIIAEAFSSRVIQPGITTTDDVVWWMRHKMLDLGLRAWFQPTIDIQSAGQELEDWNQMFFHHGEREEKRQVILPGDLLHCDMGFTYLGLSTDQQQNAYVLKAGETDAPDGLKAALAEANRLQDIHAEAMVTGRTGNEILKIALDQAREEGVNATIYTHPIGFHGHGAGPPIGSWTKPEGVPGKGDYELFDDTCYSIEFMITKAVPEWGGQEVRIALEEDAVFTGGKLHWLSGRQTHFHLIG